MQYCVAGGGKNEKRSLLPTVQRPHPEQKSVRLAKYSVVIRRESIFIFSSFVERKQILHPPLSLFVFVPEMWQAAQRNPIADAVQNMLRDPCVATSAQMCLLTAVTANSSAGVPQKNITEIRFLPCCPQTDDKP